MTPGHIGGAFPGPRLCPAQRSGGNSRRHGRKGRRASRGLTHGVWWQPAVDQPGEPRQTRSASWGPARLVPTPSGASPRGRPEVGKRQLLLLQWVLGAGGAPRPRPVSAELTGHSSPATDAPGDDGPRLIDAGTDAPTQAHCYHVTCQNLTPRRSAICQGFCDTGDECAQGVHGEGHENHGRSGEVGKTGRLS